MFAFIINQLNIRKVKINNSHLFQLILLALMITFAIKPVFAAPNVIAMDPPDATTNLPAKKALTLTFDNDVKAGTGNIYIKKVSDNSIVEQFNAATSTRVCYDSLISDFESDLEGMSSTNSQAAWTNTISFQNSGAVMVTPSTDYPYLVRNNLGGIDWSSYDSLIAWVYTSGSGQSCQLVTQSGPSWTWVTPGFVPVTQNGWTRLAYDLHQSGVTSSNMMNFGVQFGASPSVFYVDRISLKRAGTKTVTIVPTNTFSSNIAYCVQIDNGAIKDLSNASYAGISNTTTWDFQSSCTFTWDLSTSAGYQAGSGTWGTNNIWSSNGTNLVVWPSSGGNAIFAGSDGSYTVTVSGTQNVDTLTFSNSGYIIDQGTLNRTGNPMVFKADANGTIQSTISAASGIVKNGNAELIVTNNYSSGPVTINSGTFTLGGANNGDGFGSNSGGITVNSGSTFKLNVLNRINNGVTITIGNSATFDMNGNNDAIGYLNGSGAVINNNHTEGLNLDLSNGGSSTFSGTISGSGGLWIRGHNSTTTAGTQILKGALSYTGITGICNASTVPIVNNAKANLQITGGNDRLPTSTVVSFGNATATGLAGKLILGDGSSAVNQTIGGLTDVSGTGTFSVVGGNTSASTLTLNNTSDYTYNGFLGGGGTNENQLALAKSGSASLTLTAANTFTGGTTINNGIIYANNNAALGTGAVNANGGKLFLNSGVNVGNTITINSCNPGIGNAVIQGPSSGSAIVSGTININANKIYGGHFNGGNTTGGLTITGPINAASGIDILQRSGRLVLSGGGTYYSLFVCADSVLIGATNGISTSSVVDIGTSGTANLNLNGYNQTVAGLTRNVANSATVTNLSGTASTLTLNGSSTYNYKGVIAGNLSLVKQGTGTQILGGANSYTGTTTVSSGELQITGSTPSGSAVTVSSGATLSGTGNVAGAVTISNGGIIAPGVSGTGKLSTGALVLNGTSILNYELGTNSDTIAITGNLTLDGTINISALTGFNYGTYTIMTYTGTLTNNGLTVGTMPSGYTATVNAGAGAVTLTVKANQTINFGALPGKAYGDGDFAPGATVSSGLTISYSSSDPTVATIVGGQIHIVGVGTSTITASQAGDANYNAAVNVTQTLTVGKANQTITFNAIANKVYGDGDFALGATASSGLTVTYSSSNTSVATIVSNQIHIVGAGTSTITASQSGNAIYNAASNVTQVLTVNKTSQTITFNALSSKVFGDADFSPGATSSSGLTVSYASSNTSVATIVSGQIHIVGVGSTTITASQSGNTNYNAANDVTQVLTVTSTNYVWDMSVGAGFQAGSGTWGVDNYWSVNGTTLLAWPGAGNNATFAGSNGNYTITINGTQSTDTLTFGNTGYTLAGGILNLSGVSPSIKADVDAIISSTISTANGFTKNGSGNLIIKAGYNGGTVSLNAGTITLSTMSSDAFVPGGSGILINSGATLVDGQDLIGNSVTINLAGGTLNLNNNSDIIGFIYGSGNVTNSAGLTLDLNNGVSHIFTGSISGNGGLFLRGNNSTGSAGTFVISGVQTYTGVTGISNASSGLNNSAKTILQLTGGDNRLSTSTVISFGHNGSSNLTGKLILGGGTTSNQTIAGLTDVNGTGTFSVVGGNASVSLLTVNNSSNYTFNGIIGGVGTNENNIALTKSGSGVLTLAGVNTYTGNTVVSAGTLMITGSTAAGSGVTVQSGAILGGTGSVGGTTNVNNGGVISPGNAGVGTLSTGPLILNSSSVLNYDLGTSSDNVNVTGALTLDGTLNISVTAGFGAGNYTLMNYSGSLTDNGLSIGTVPSGYTASVSTGSGVVTLNVKANQTITFAAISGKNLTDADFNPGATASSGLSVTYTSSNTSVATIVAGQIHIVGVGTSTITASQSGNGSYNAAPDVAQTLTVGKGSQTITFNALPGKVYGEADFPPGATASSSLAVSYTSSNPSVATIVAGQIHIVGIGTSTITASQSGNANYSAAIDVTQTLTVGKGNQVITFNALPGKEYGDADFAPEATASSGLAVNYTSSDVSVATIISGQIHIVGVGTTTITASQSGNALYNAAADVQKILSVGKASQAITFNALPINKKVGDADFDPGATASSGLVVNYSSDNASVATLINGKIHIVGSGTATITASQAGDGHYNAATDVIQTFTVGKGDQTITFAALPDKVCGDADFVPGATVSSGLTITYTSSNPAVATIISGQIHVVGAGSSIITASQSGDANYNAALDVTQTLTVTASTFTWDVSTSAGFQSGNGIWGTDNYWTNNGTVLIAWPGAGNNARFAGSNGNYSITINNVQAVDTLVFSNSGYVLSGGSINLTSTSPLITSAADAKIISSLTGSNGLIKDGNGILTIAGINSYTGNTTITTGTLQIGDGGVSGDIPGNVINNAKLEFNRSDLYTFGHVINGSGQLVKNGSGQLVIEGVNTYSGTTTVNSGSLVFDNNGSIYNDGSSSGALIINNGGTVELDRNDFMGIFSSTPNATVNIGAGGILKSNNSYSTLNNLSLNGGKLQSNGGLNVTWGTFALKGQVNVNGTTVSTIEDLGGANNFIMVGDNTSGGVTNFNVADNTVGTDLDVKTVLSDNRDLSSNSVASGIIKTGTGTMLLEGVNTYTGPTTVSNGALEVTGSISSNSAVTVQTGAVLSGTGNIAGTVTINNNGIITPGVSSTGTLTVGSLLMNNSSIINMELGTSSDKIAVTNNLTLDGIINVSTATGFGHGTYTIMTYSGALTDNGLAVGSMPNGYTASISTGAGVVSLIVKSNQTITFNSLASKNVGDIDLDPGATVTSGLPISYTSSNTSVATIVAGKIHFVGSGTTVITASQGGDANYNAATSATQNLTVGKGDQTITFAALPAKNMGDVDFDPGATASSGLPVSYTSSNQYVATIIDGKIHIVGVGTSVITASQAGDANYNGAVSVTQTLTAGKEPQTISFAVLSQKTFGDIDFDAGATASSGLPVSYTSSNLSVATIVAGKIHIVGAGISTITVSQAGNAVYSAAPDVNQSLTVNKAGQTITFAPLSDKDLGEADYDPGATTSSGLAASYTSSNASIATIVAGKIHIVGVGTADITASQGGDANYNAAVNVLRTLTVRTTDQTITFNALPEKKYGDADFNAGATASSGLAISYSSSNTSVATIVGGLIHITGAGTSTITASQSGNGSYSPATDVSQLLIVIKADQTIAFNALPVKAYGDADFAPGATASSGLLVSYESNNDNIATIINGQIHIVGAGSVVITAIQLGNVNYNAAIDVSKTLIISKKDQTITFNAIPGKFITDGDFDPGAITSSGLSVMYSSADPSIATILDGKIHIAGIGSTQITASQAGNENYNSAVDKNQTLTVSKGIQSITFNALPVKVYNDANFSAGATASSGLGVVYASSDTNVAKIVGDQIHITGVGTTTITASQPGNATYTAAPNVSQNLTVNKADQTITFDNFPVKTYGDVDFNPGAFTSSGLTIDYSSSNVSVATIVAGQIHITGAGTATITASQAGNANYSAAVSVSKTLTVNKADQAINFNVLPSKNIHDTDFSAGATASSGLAVTYTNSNLNVATIINGKIHIIGTGSSVVTASQTGNANYNAAADESQILDVGKIAQHISFTALQVKKYGDANFSPGAAASSGLPVSYTSSNTSVATIVNDSIHIAGVGTATITAIQMGDSTYGQALSVSQLLTVVKADQSITFAALPIKLVGNADFIPGAVASSGLNVTYSSSDTTVATITGNQIHIKGAGNTNITASQAGDSLYNAALNVIRSLTVDKSSQTITFNALVSKKYGDADFLAAATASSGLSVSYTSNNVAVASIINGLIHITGVGTATITADQAGNNTYASATSVQQILTVGKADQTISFGALPSKKYGDADFSAGATVSSGLTVSYTSSDTAIAKISQGQIHITGVGTAVITAIQSGDSLYNAATNVTQNLVVNKADQIITFGALPSKKCKDPDFSAGATASSGLVASYTSDNPNVATIINGYLHIVGSGNAIITASQAGNGFYNAATNVTQNLMVVKNDQTITFMPLPEKDYGDSDFTPVVTSSSGLSVSFSSSDTNVAKIINGKIHITGLGSTIITASQSGNADYYPAPNVNQTFVIGKKDQSITFTPIPEKVYGDTDFIPAATASSGLPVNYSTSDTVIAKIINGKVHIAGAGSVTITASQQGNLSFKIAPVVQQVLTIKKKDILITADNKTRLYGEQNPILTWKVDGLMAGENTSVLDVKPVISTIATSDSSVGNYDIIVSGGNDANYNITYKNGTFTINKAPQAISFATLTNHIIQENYFTLNASASSGLPITYTSDTNKVTISHDTCHMNDTGCIIITARQNGSKNIDSAQSIQQRVCINSIELIPPVLIVINRKNVSVTPNLSWHSVTGATKYRIQISTNSDFSTITYDKMISDTTIIPDTLLHNQTYYWHVLSMNKFSASVFCSPENFITIDHDPEIPVLIVKEEDRVYQSLTPKLTWHKALYANNYHLQLSKEINFTKVVFDTTISDTTLMTDSLERDAMYYWHVSAVNTAGSSKYSSPDSLRTIKQLLSVPVIKSIFADTTRIGTTVTLDWDTVMFAKEYVVKVAVDAAFSTLVIDTIVKDSSLLVVSGLLNSKTYYWHLYARNANSLSNWSQTEKFTTMPYKDGYIQTTTTVVNNNNTVLSKDVSIKIDSSSSAKGQAITIITTKYDNTAKLINVSQIMDFCKSTKTAFNGPVNLVYTIPSVAINGLTLDSLRKITVRPYFIDDSNKVKIIYNAKYDSNGKIIISEDTLKKLFFAIDTIPPSITDNSVKDAQNVGSTPVISGLCNDNISNSKYIVHFRKGGELSYDSLPIVVDPNNKFSISLGLSTLLDSNGLEYYLSATDGVNVVNYYRQNLSAILTNQMSVDTFPTMKWHLFAVPMEMQNDSISALLSSLGEYGKMWRLYKFVNKASDTLIEFGQGLSEIKPGEAYWLKTKKEKEVLKISQAKTVAINQCYTMSIPAHKWVSISDPYLFSVSWKSILDSSNVTASTLIGPYSYEDSAWLPPSSIDKMEPWKGYYVMNNSEKAVTLRIPSIKSSPSLSKKLVKDYNVALEWVVTGGNGKDCKNFFGIANNSSDDYDPAVDFPKPESPETGVRTYFSRLGLKKVSSKFQTDFTNLKDGGATWTVVIDNMQPNTSYFCHVNKLEQLSDTLEIWLIDKASNSKWNVRNGDYGLAVTKGASSVTLDVVVGNSAYVDKVAGFIKMLPTRFSCSNVYPNPARGIIKINYAIPYDYNAIRVPVNIAIYTLSGRKAFSIPEDIKAAGYYSISINMSSKQQSLPSGSYVIRLSAGRNWKNQLLRLVN